MITQDLIDAIITKYKAGLSKTQIKEDLINDGYDETDIEDSINHIQKTALMQFPAVATVVDYVSRFNDFVTRQSVGHSMRVLAGLCVFMLVVSIILYHIFNQYQKGPAYTPTNSVVYVTATPAAMQTGFTITGSVLSEVKGSGQAIEKQGFGNAQISIADQNGNKICNIRTDTQGRFSCAAQNPGTFTVAIGKIPNYVVVGQSELTIVEPDTTNSKVSFTIVPLQ